MLLLLSSDAQRRYGDDIIRALAHPVGTDFQFRYALKYIDPALHTKATTGTLTGETALIAFLATDATKRTATVIACRLVTLRRSEMVGSAWIVTLTAGDYVHPIDDHQLRTRLSPAKQALLPTFPPGGGSATGHFVIDVTADLTAGYRATSVEAMQAFEETAAALSGFSHFDASNKIAFYAVRGITRLAWDRPGWLGGKPKRIPAEFKDGIAALASGERCDLQVYTYAPAAGGATTGDARLVVDSDEKGVRFVSGKQADLDSRYDLRHFSFTTDHLLDSLSAGIGLHVAVPTGPGAGEDRCDITVPVIFRGHRWLGIARMLLIASGTAVPAMIAIAFKDQFNWWIGMIMGFGALVAAFSTVFLGKKA